jgi:hypothetical protein
LLIGLDFDNTIVCYDRAIAQLAETLPDLPADLPRTKLALRDYLRGVHREPEWTAFQGAIYGPGMTFAEPFVHALEVMQTLKDMGHSLCIVSHRSLRPYAGPAYDLHTAARVWVQERLACTGLVQNESAFFYETREQKISAVSALGCDVFLDDLPEVLADAHFPQSCQAILFDPERSHPQSECTRIAHWSELPALISGQA